MAIPAGLIIGGISALTGLANLFSGSGEPDYDKLWDDYMKKYKRFDVQKAQGDIARFYNSKRKSRQAGIEAKNSAMGLNNPTDVYSNEEDLVTAEQSALTDISKIKQQEDNDLANAELQLKAGKPIPESSFSKVLSGGLIGADLGLQIQGLIDKRLPDDDTPTTDSTITDSVDNNKQDISNEIMGNGVNQKDLLEMFKKLSPEKRQEYLKYFASLFREARLPLPIIN